MLTLFALPSARLHVLPLFLALFFPGFTGAVSAADTLPPPADDTFFESVDVAVTNIEVFVTDRSGKPVSGLTKDDFEVLENGKQVEITHFFSQDVARDAAVPADPSAPSPSSAEPSSAAAPPEQRTLAVFVDNGNLTLWARKRGLQGIEKAVAGLAPRDRFVLIELGTALRMQSFSGADTEQIRRALQKKIAPGGGDKAAAWDELDNRLATADDPTVRSIVLQDMESFEKTRENEAAATYEALGRSADVLAGLPGHKAVLVLTGDLPVPSRLSLSRLLARANAARVTLYGLGIPPATRMGDQASPHAQVIRSLMEMAGGTGGQFVSDPSDPSRLAAQVVGDLTTFYSLGYAPPAGKANVDRSVKVRVKRPGLSVRYRESYRVKSGVERARDRTTAALLLGEASNPLGVAVELGQAVLNEKGHYVVEVTVKFPLGRMALLPAGGMRKGRLLLFLGSRDIGGGKVSELTPIVLPLNIPEDKLAEALQQQGGYRTRLLLRAEPSEIVVGLRDDLGNADSTLLVPWSPPVGVGKK